MKKILTMMLGATLLLGSCGTCAEDGASTGAYFGSILGAAIGGIADGPRGSDIGTIVGMAGGAVVGAVIGDQADQAEQKRYEEHRSRATQRSKELQRWSTSPQDDIDQYDPTGSGNDVIEDFEPSDSLAAYTEMPQKAGVLEVSRFDLERASVQMRQPLDIRHVHFEDENQDGNINSRELCKVVFEVFNVSNHPVDNILPVVEEGNANKRITISPSVKIERIMPGKGIRYTAMVLAGKKLGEGEADFRIFVKQDDDKHLSKTRHLLVSTKR